MKKATKKSAATKKDKKVPTRTRSRASDPATLVRLRKICFALPETTEVEAWQAPTFRVKNKLFAMYTAAKNGHTKRDGVWLKSTHFTQDQLMREEPDRFFKPPYVGPSGWVGVHLDKRPDWTVVAALVEDAYRMTAPKKLLATPR